MKALAAAFAFAAALCPAHAALVVSTAPTSNVTCSAGVCSAAAADAVLNVKDLRHLLAAGDVTVASGSVAQDIDFAAKLQWTRNSRLTLDAYRGIAVSLDITSEGTGGVTLTTDDGGDGGELVFAGKGKVSFWDTASSLTIDGVSYTLVDSIQMLAASVAANPNGFYALSKFYDASADGTYASDPVPVAFGGTFEGLGHVIANLKLKPAGTGDYGFFASIAPPGTVRDVTFDNPVVTASAAEFAAVLAGVNQGTVSRVNVVAAAVSGRTEGAAGLVGKNDAGSISWCATSGSVAADGQYSLAGGLAGVNTGAIAHSSSAAVVQGHISGGLVAYNQGSIALSYATGSVSQIDFNKEDSYTGGLAGRNLGMIDQSFATGAVNGGNGGEGHGHHVHNPHYYVYAGGLTTDNYGAVTNSYSTGSVAIGGFGYSGGFAFSSDDAGSIGTSYATGAMSGLHKKLYGFANYLPDATNAYWDIDTSGTKKGCSDACTGVTGLTTAQFQSGLPAGFDPAIWAQSPGVNDGYPYLIANPPQ
jgi:hypothetical protein